MSSFAFLVVQKYVDKGSCTYKMRFISRNMENLYQNIWKRLYGSCFLRDFEDIKFAKKFHHVVIKIFLGTVYGGGFLIPKELGELIGFRKGYHTSDIAIIERALNQTLTFHAVERKKRIMNLLDISESDYENNKNLLIQKAVIYLKNNKNKYMREIFEKFKNVKKISIMDNFSSDYFDNLIEVLHESQTVEFYNCHWLKDSDLVKMNKQRNIIFNYGEPCRISDDGIAKLENAVSITFRAQESSFAFGNKFDMFGLGFLKLKKLREIRLESNFPEFLHQSIMMEIVDKELRKKGVKIVMKVNKI